MSSAFTSATELGLEGCGEGVGEVCLGGKGCCHCSGSSRCCGAGLIPGLATSTCHRHGQKKKKKNSLEEVGIAKGTILSSKHNLRYMVDIL